MYKCPGCGVGLKFDILTQLLKCDYCGSTYPAVEAQENGKTAREFETNVFVCTQCGGEIYTQDNDITGRCSYCGSDMVFQNRIAKMARPQKIIPFQKDKSYCKGQYQSMAKRAIFAPKEMRDESSIDQFRGIYMPFWVYDVERSGEFATTGTKSYTRGNYDYTDHYNLTGYVEAEYPGLVHDASSSFSDEISERIVPYKLSQNVEDFNTAYLCGFYGEMEDVDADEYLPYVKEITDQDVTTFIKDQFSDLSVSPVSGDEIETNYSQKSLYLLPVWFMAWRQKDRVVYATVNGQTGRATAEFPVDIRKFFLYAGLLTLPLFFLYNFLFTFRPPVTAGLASIAALVTLFLYRRDLRMIVRKNSEMAKLTNQLEFTEEEEELIGKKQATVNWAAIMAMLGSIAFAAIAILGVMIYMDFDVFDLIAFIVVFLAEFIISDLFMVLLAGLILIIGLFLIREADKLYKIAKRLHMTLLSSHYFLIGAMAFALVVEIIAPASDLVFYGLAVIIMAIVVVTLVSLISCHNYIATMPMPQFAHKGGDDGDR